MCGIAGTFRLTGSVLAEDVSAVLRMLDAQIRRGPDDWGLLVPDSALADAEIRRLLERYDPAHVHAYPAVPGAPAAVLGSRRLSIIDLSTHGRMPMGSDDGRRWVVQNGEIYNYRELRAELVGAGAFRSATDTEVLVRGWEAWENGVTERLRGMFAFALFEAAPRPDCSWAATRSASSRCTATRTGRESSSPRKCAPSSRAVSFLTRQAPKPSAAFSSSASAISISTGASTCVRCARTFPTLQSMSISCRSSGRISRDRC